MDAPEHYELMAGYALFRPAGLMKLAKLGAMVAEAISHARDSGASRLMVVLMDVRGILPPRLNTRHRLVSSWAQAARGKVRLAVVTTARMIDPGGFGVLVATNAGMTANVFVEEQAALKWLLAEETSQGDPPVKEEAALPAKD